MILQGVGMCLGERPPRALLPHPSSLTSGRRSAAQNPIRVVPTLLSDACLGSPLKNRSPRSLRCKGFSAQTSFFLPRKQTNEAHF